MILEEYVSPTQPPAQEPPYVCVLSARDAERLDAHIARTAEFLRGEGRDTHPAAIAATLCTREPMAHRLAVVFDAVDDLADALEGHLAGADSPRVMTGTVSRSAAPATGRSAPELAAAWVRAAHVVWPGGGPRVSLPGYPFARERCWLPAADAVRRPPVTEPRGEVVLSTDTPVIAGHRVQGRALLPALAYPDLIAKVFRDHGYAVEPADGARPHRAAPARRPPTGP